MRNQQINFEVGTISMPRKDVVIDDRRGNCVMDTDLL
jgi:hypothetical protein